MLKELYQEVRGAALRGCRMCCEVVGTVPLDYMYALCPVEGSSTKRT
jgi:hypothetical protein